MAKIHLLSQQLANMIAAGEVVERPASVAKELVENAIDAGSRRITVEIKSGGVAYLRVTDDGHGIPAEDVALAFRRHATSKLYAEEDLMCIRTLGFRGEALASVASVAKVDLFTCTPDSDTGVQYSIEGGEETAFHETGCPVGTTVVVRDLFYNIPARAKFLKKDSTEGAYVEQAVVQQAIAHPEVAVTFIREGKEIFSTPGKGNMQDSIYAIYGKDLAEALVAVIGDHGEIRLSGFVARPVLNRPNRNYQHFYINGRCIRSRLLSAAVEEAFKGKTTVGRFPVCFLNLQMSPAALDVNVHPAKLEVKFAREREVFSAVYHSVCTALDALQELEAMRRAARPQEDNVTAQQQRLEVQAEEKQESRPVLTTRAYTPAKPTYTFPEGHTTQYSKVADSAPMMKYETTRKPLRIAEERPRLEIRHEPVFEDLPVHVKPVPVSEPVQPVSQPAKETAQPQEETREIRVIGEAFRTYIMAEDHEGIWLIDKHAAHEKILYDKLCAQDEPQPGQILLTPLAVSLSSEEKDALIAAGTDLSTLGFQVEDGGIGGLLVREIPVYLDVEEAPFLLAQVAQQLREGRKAESQVLDELRKSIACKAAVKAGNFTAEAELVRFAKQVLADETVRNCPHGRPAVVYLSRYELEKMFKRVQP